jgi:hypothetical protein
MLHNVNLGTIRHKADFEFSGRGPIASPRLCCYSDERSLFAYDRPDPKVTSKDRSQIKRSTPKRARDAENHVKFPVGREKIT